MLSTLTSIRELKRTLVTLTEVFTSVLDTNVTIEHGVQGKLLWTQVAVKELLVHQVHNPEARIHRTASGKRPRAAGTAMRLASHGRHGERKLSRSMSTTVAAFNPLSTLNCRAFGLIDKYVRPMTE